MKWILIVCGALTATMVQGLFAPQSMLLANFGAKLEHPIAEVLVRSWSAFVAYVGVLLVYAALRPAYRKPILFFASTGKLTFIALVLCFGREFLSLGAGTAVIADSIMVALFTAYLVTARGTNAVT
jgi:hypothetical protein